MQPPPPPGQMWPNVSWSQAPTGPPTQGGWVWQDAKQATKGKHKKTSRQPLALTSELDKEEDSEEEEREKKKRKKEKNWEKETKKQRNKRYKKYERMSETADAEKQSVKHQVSAMFKSVIAQEKVVEHLRSLQYEDASEEQVQDNKLSLIHI